MEEKRKPLTTWDIITADELLRTTFDDGLVRSLPPIGMILLCGLAISHTAVGMDELSKFIGSPHNPQRRWDAPCWEPPEPLTDEELARLRAEYDDGDDQDDRSAAELNAEEEELHRQHIATIDSYAAHYDLPPVRTCRDVVDLLVAAGIWHRENGKLSPLYPVPRPEDVFPVSDDEREQLIRLRAACKRERIERGQGS